MMKNTYDFSLPPQDFITYGNAVEYVVALSFKLVHRLYTQQYRELPKMYKSIPRLHVPNSHTLVTYPEYPHPRMSVFQRKQTVTPIYINRMKLRTREDAAEGMERSNNINCLFASQRG